MSAPPRVIVLLFAVMISMAANGQRRANDPNLGEIHINLSEIPEKVHLEKTPLRYNKRFAMSFHADDGLADVFSIGFRFFTGVNSPSTHYSGLFYTDGCGNDVSFKISSALFSFSAYNNEDMHRQGNPYNAVSWLQLDTMYQHGCGIYNHGLNSDAPSDQEAIYYSIRRNESYIQRSLARTNPGGVRTRVLVNPNGMSQFSPIAFSLGYRYAFRMGAWQQMPETGMNVGAFSAWDKPLELNRVLAETVNVRQLADLLSSKSHNGNHYWMPVFTHSIIENYPLDKFYDDWNYIAKTYGKIGTDDIWMASEEEILNYLLVRQRVQLNYSLVGNKLIIRLYGDLPPDLRFYPLTLLVHTPGAQIKKVAINAGTQNTHSATGSDKVLINLSWTDISVVSIAELAEKAVRMAEQNPKNSNALVAMDYVIAMPHGSEKENLRRRLCRLTPIDYEPEFCIRPGK